jgi:hypothetical protein
MRRWLVCILVVIFWVIMTLSHLIKEEILFPPPIQLVNFRTIFKGRIPYHEEWMGIYLHGEKVGYASSYISPYKVDGLDGIVVRTLTEVNIPFGGEEIWVTIQGYSLIDQEWRISKMDYKILSGLYSMRIEGEKADEIFEIRFHTDGESYTHMIPISATSSLLSPIYLLPEMRPKRVYKIEFLNPFTQRYTTANLKIEGKKRVTIDGREEVYLVRVDVEGTTAHLWVRKDGEVIKIDTPFGWTLIREEEEDAIKGFKMEGR